MLLEDLSAVKDGQVRGYEILCLLLTGFLVEKACLSQRWNLKLFHLSGWLAQSNLLISVFKVLVVSAICYLLVPRVVSIMLIVNPPGRGGL